MRSIFRNNSFIFHIIWWGRNINLNIMLYKYLLFLVFTLFAFCSQQLSVFSLFRVTANLEKCNLNFLKKVQLFLATKINVKLTKFSSLTNKVWQKKGFPKQNVMKFFLQMQDEWNFIIPLGWKSYRENKYIQFELFSCYFLGFFWKTSFWQVNWR